MIVDERYRLLSVLGQGGMGVVWFAEHLKLRQGVAIKVLREEFCSDAVQKTRFEREGRLLSRLQHPHVIRVQDYGHQEGLGAYLVMEFLEGPSLKSVIKEQAPLSVEYAFTIIQQITSALSAAHQAGMVHRDLKPANILLVENQGMEIFAKVLDFGIAKAMQKTSAENLGETLTATGTVVGTPQYMSPEQMSGNTCPGTDLYALGVIWFELLEGERPFTGESQMEILVKHLKEAPPPLSRADVPVSMEELIQQLLEKEPAARPVNAGALSEILTMLGSQRDPPPADQPRQDVDDGTTADLASPDSDTVERPRTRPSVRNRDDSTRALEMGSVEEDTLGDHETQSVLPDSKPSRRSLVIYITLLIVVPALVWGLRDLGTNKSNTSAPSAPIVPDVIQAGGTTPEADTKTVEKLPRNTSDTRASSHANGQDTATASQRDRNQDGEAADVARATTSPAKRSPKTEPPKAKDKKEELFTLRVITKPRASVIQIFDANRKGVAKGRATLLKRVPNGRYQIKARKQYYKEARRWVRDNGRDRSVRIELEPDVSGP